MTALPSWLDAAFEDCGAAAWAAAPYSAAEALMSLEAREKAEASCPGAATVFVAAFPYLAKGGEGNLSLYARGEDYHLVLHRRLEAVCEALRAAYRDKIFLCGADNSPLSERELAWHCGLGLRGRHGLVILPPYGSYVFLGTILTDQSFALPAYTPSSACENCGACERACPTGALSDGVVDPLRCLSALTQRKGELSEEESALLRAHSLIWGCDACQRACPHNAAAAETSLSEFREDLMPSLETVDLAGLTNRTFREKYGRRAFAWRGLAVLRRNLALKEKREEEKDGNSE